MATKITNIAAYKFVKRDQRILLREQESFRRQCSSLGIRGTILLAEEGINLFLAAEQEPIRLFQGFIEEIDHYHDLTYKVSYSNTIPFKRLYIRLKKEIITMGRVDIHPEEFTGPHISPAELKQWIDENRPFMLLDTRNDYEIEFGTFKNAQHLNIKSFRDFPEALGKLPPAAKNQPVVMYCTGGIRCEKASAQMLVNGFTDVYQLDGGILNYFETCGGEHFDGKCFVFDERVAVDGRLVENGIEICPGCQSEVPPSDQLSPANLPGSTCPHCLEKNAD